MSDAPSGDDKDLPLWRRINTAPHLSDARRAEVRLAELLTTPNGAELQNLAGHTHIRALLLAIADHSPFLWRLAAANAPRIKRCLETADRKSVV